MSANALLLELTDQLPLDPPARPFSRSRDTHAEVAGGMTVTVQQVERGRPKRGSFDFGRPIEETELRLFSWQKSRLTSLSLRVGESASHGGR